MRGLLPDRTSRIASARVPSGNSAGRSRPAASASNGRRKLTPGTASRAPELAALIKRRRVIIISCLIGPLAARVGLATGCAKARLQKKWVGLRILFQRQTGARRATPCASGRGVNPARGVMAMNPGRTSSVPVTGPFSSYARAVRWAAASCERIHEPCFAYLRDQEIRDEPQPRELASSRARGRLIPVPELIESRDLR